jgi:hypothetical protein
MKPKPDVERLAESCMPARQMGSGFVILIIEIVVIPKLLSQAAAKKFIEDLYGSSRIFNDREKTSVVLLRVADW